jgi:hypothetical protein
MLPSFQIVAHFDNYESSYILASKYILTTMSLDLLKRPTLGTDKIDNNAQTIVLSHKFFLK